MIKLNPVTPIVKQDGTMENQFRNFMLEVSLRAIIIGAGSPEGVVEATVGQEYMRTDGTASAIKYIKRDSDIAGDRTQGWILI